MAENFHKFKILNYKAGANGDQKFKKWSANLD